MFFTSLILKFKFISVNFLQLLNIDFILVTCDVSKLYILILFNSKHESNILSIFKTFEVSK